MSALVTLCTLLRPVQVKAADDRSSHKKRTKAKEIAPWLKWLGGLGLSAGGSMALGAEAFMPTETRDVLRDFVEKVPSEQYASGKVAPEDFLKAYTQYGSAAVQTRALGIPIPRWVELGRRLGAAYEALGGTYKHPWTEKSRAHYAALEKGQDAARRYVEQEYNTTDPKQLADALLEPAGSYKNIARKATNVHDSMLKAAPYVVAAGGAALILHWILNKLRNKRDQQKASTKLPIRQLVGLPPMEKSAEAPKVRFVNGARVRDNVEIDFTSGGHGYVYPQIPKDEIWLDQTLKSDPNDAKAIYMHEAVERVLMKDKGKSYDSAHEQATDVEARLRKSAQAAPPAIPTNDIADYVRHWEGFRDKPYRDTKGVWTVGHGINLKDPLTRQMLQSMGTSWSDVIRQRRQLTPAELDQLFIRHFERAVATAQKYHPGLAQLPPSMQAIAIDMAYNLGEPRYRGFKRAIPALNKGNYTAYAKELRNSAWFSDTKARGLHHWNTVRAMASGRPLPPLQPGAMTPVKATKPADTATTTTTDVQSQKPVTPPVPAAKVSG